MDICSDIQYKDKEKEKIYPNDLITNSNKLKEQLFPGFDNSGGLFYTGKKVVNTTDAYKQKNKLNSDKLVNFFNKFFFYMSKKIILTPYIWESMVHHQVGKGLSDIVKRHIFKEYFGITETTQEFQQIDCHHYIQ